MFSSISPNVDFQAARKRNGLRRVRRGGAPAMCSLEETLGQVLPGLKYNEVVLALVLGGLNHAILEIHKDCGVAVNPLLRGAGDGRRFVDFFWL
jgi:hypothetical protein